MATDVLVSCLLDPKRNTLTLHGRRGVYEDDAPDVFFLTSEHADKLPSSWRDCVSHDRGFARVRWPERARGPRWQRLEHFTKGEFAKLGVVPLEADVDPIQRWIIDHPQATFPSPGEWHVFYYDLETEQVDWAHKWKSRILSYSWRSTRTGRSGHVRLEAKTDKAEAALLEKLVRQIAGHDVAMAWNGDGFDHPQVQSRCEVVGVAFDVESVHWLDHLQIFKRNFLRTEDGGVKQSMALDSISEALLGVERKVPLSARAKGLGWDGAGDLFSWSWENAPDLFREYNDQDVRLMQLLEEKTGFVELHMSIARLCRVLPERRSQFPSTLIDGRMLGLGEEHGYRFPTRPAYEKDRESSTAMGAYVPEAKRGVFDSIAVVDYARMYPSIIRAFNLSLDTLDPEGDVRVPRTTDKGAVDADGALVARFSSEKEGIVPMALRAIIDERKRYSALKSSCEVGSPEWHDAGRLSTACKVLANSFYGVLLSRSSRYYRAEIGESVTSVGRLLLSRTIKEVERRGHFVAFGDTDSVAFGATDDQAVAVRDAVNKEIVPAILDEYGARQGEVRLEYEKRFAVVLVTASKKYAGRFAVYDGKPVAGDKIDIRGLEIVRSDSCRAARQLQRSVVEQILARTPEHEMRDAMIAIREEFLKGSSPVPDLLLRRSITKPLDEYVSKPPQVQVAERMVERGEDVMVGMKVPFVWERGRAISPDEIVESIDYALYWNEHVWPATQRCLEAAYPRGRWDFAVPRGFDPNQLDIFAPQAEAPTPKRLGIGSPKTRRGSRPVVITVDSRTAYVDRLKDVTDSFPGAHPLRVVVRDEVGRTEVELACPQRVASPEADPRMASTLGALGFRWNIGVDGKKKTT